VVILTPGNVADCTVGPECVNMIAGVKELLATRPMTAMNSANNSGGTASSP
jgi:hypothetical protein